MGIDPGNNFEFGDPNSHSVVYQLDTKGWQLLGNYAFTVDDEAGRRHFLGDKMHNCFRATFVQPTKVYDVG